MTPENANFLTFIFFVIVGVACFVWWLYDLAEHTGGWNEPTD